MDLGLCKWTLWRPSIHVSPGISSLSLACVRIWTGSHVPVSLVPAPGALTVPDMKSQPDFKRLEQITERFTWEDVALPPWIVQSTPMDTDVYGKPTQGSIFVLWLSTLSATQTGSNQKVPGRTGGRETGTQNVLLVQPRKVWFVSSGTFFPTVKNCVSACYIIALCPWRAPDQGLRRSIVCRPPFTNLRRTSLYDPATTDARCFPGIRAVLFIPLWLLRCEINLWTLQLGASTAFLLSWCRLQSQMRTVQRWLCWFVGSSIHQSEWYSRRKVLAGGAVGLTVFPIWPIFWLVLTKLNKMSECTCILLFVPRSRTNMMTCSCWSFIQYSIGNICKNKCSGNKCSIPATQFQYVVSLNSIPTVNWLRIQKWSTWSCQLSFCLLAADVAKL